MKMKIQPVVLAALFGVACDPVADACAGDCDGAVCDADTCEEGSCYPLPANSPCASDDDCGHVWNGVCGSEGLCTRPCGPNSDPNGSTPGGEMGDCRRGPHPKFDRCVDNWCVGIHPGHRACPSEPDAACPESDAGTSDAGCPTPDGSTSDGGT